MMNVVGKSKNVKAVLLSLAIMNGLIMGVLIWFIGPRKLMKRNEEIKKLLFNIPPKIIGNNKYL